MTVHTRDRILQGLPVSLTPDKQDYAPGSTAFFTVTDVEVGATFEFQVLHVDGEGVDGVWGTTDDQLDDGVDETYGTADDGYGPNPNGNESDNDRFYAIDGVGAAGLDGVFGTDDDLMIDPSTGLLRSRDFDEDTQTYKWGNLVADLDRQENGQIVVGWYVRDPDSLNERFLLSAAEVESVDAGADGVLFTDDDSITYTGAGATATFTDGTQRLAAWRNQPGPTFEEWDAGTTIQQANSVYAEGEVIPFRWTIEPGNPAPELQEGISYTIQIDWAFRGGTTAPEKFFFDYLTSYNATESADAPFADLAAGNLQQVPIPVDPNPDIVGQAAGFFDLYNIDPSSVTFGTYTAQPVNSNQEDRLLNVTFTPDDGDGVAGEFLTVGVAWGAHLATQGQYGPDNGAASFPGASPQMVVDLSPSVSGDVTNLSINPNAIVAQGEITVIKDTNPDNPQDFGFTITGPDGANITPNFVLDDDGDPANGTSNAISFFGLVEGVYTITEDLTSGWSLAGINSVENGAEDTTVDDIAVDDVATRTATITVANGEVWTTTFTNVLAPAAPSISIEKLTNGVDADTPAERPTILVGDPVTWTYLVTNDGDVPLTAISVLDDAGSAGDTGDDFYATFVSGDGGIAGALDVGETWTFTASATAVAGDYGNLGTATATYTDAANNTTPVNDTDPSGYFGAVPSLNVTKTNDFTEGGYADNDGSGDLSVGDLVTYTYLVTNTGTANLTNVTALDDLLGAVTLSDDAMDGVGFLAVGDSESGTLTYTIDADDLGTDIVNEVVADSTQTDPVTDTNTIPVPTPSLSVAKSNRDKPTSSFTRSRATERPRGVR